MRSEIREQLLSLNRKFYSEFADAFAATRTSPQPGFWRLLEYLPDPCGSVVDVGCGSGRFGQFLQNQAVEFTYTGIDFTERFLTLAVGKLKGQYYQRDISEPGFLEESGIFDLGVCLATMQHIPGRTGRLRLLQEAASHIRKGGRIFLSNWQFAHSERQRRKILDWRVVGLEPGDVEPNDFLLSWERNGPGIRYVHLVDESETLWLATAVGMNVVEQFRSDGKEGDLNLYTVLSL